MAGQSSTPDERFHRLAALPPYVLATVDELKSRLRAAGHDIYDFGLGNPDGASPRAAPLNCRAIQVFLAPLPSLGVPMNAEMRRISRY